MLCTLSRLASAMLIAGLLVGSLAAQEPVAYGAGAGGRVHGGLLHQGGRGGYVCRDADDGNPDLFYNYYVADGCDQVAAQLYVAPQPVPPLVGHTYITYQPLMPHELLYKHHHHYYRYYDGGRGMTRASVVYYNPPLRTGIANAWHHFRIPR